MCVSGKGREAYGVGNENHKVPERFFPININPKIDHSNMKNGSSLVVSCGSS